MGTLNKFQLSWNTFRKLFGDSMGAKDTWSHVHAYNTSFVNLESVRPLFKMARAQCAPCPWTMQLVSCINLWRILATEFISWLSISRPYDWKNSDSACPPKRNQRNGSRWSLGDAIFFHHSDRKMIVVDPSQTQHKLKFEMAPGPFYIFLPHLPRCCKLRTCMKSCYDQSRICGTCGASADTSC